MYAKTIQVLIQALTKLPSVGPRTAERFVFYLLKSGKKEVGELTLALKQLMETIKSCDVCYDFTDQSPCPLCSDNNRTNTIIAVVAEPPDIQAMERIKTFTGRYHVLRGTLQADSDDALRGLKIPELFQRIRQESTEEVILAFNPDMNGEVTMLFLEKKIHELKPSMKVSRLARGLPMGSDLRYADDITLESALSHRTAITNNK